MTKPDDSRLKITLPELRERLSYDPESGVFTWLVGKWKGTRAGMRQPNGRRQIKLDGVFVYSNRLAFLFMTGRWPNGVVDHEDRDRSNDAWNNLRDITQAHNTRNNKLSISNKSGVRRVRFDPHIGYWKFSAPYKGDWIKGIRNSMEEAVEARLEILKRDVEAHEPHVIQECENYLSTRTTRC